MTALVDVSLLLGRAAAPSAVGLLRAVGRKKYDEFVATQTNALNAFLTATRSRCSDLKTLLNREISFPLSDLYVNTKFQYGTHYIGDEAIVRRLQTETAAFVIVGLAGSGKSMFMKWAALCLIDSMLNHQRIPLFIEVRDLPHPVGIDGLDEIIFRHTTDSTNAANLTQFKIGLREGMFIIMLDGVDETPAEHLDQFLRALQDFKRRYNQCMVLASVRPGTQLGNIPQFQSFQVMEMGLDQINRVIEKAPYDKERKEILLRSLNDGLYIAHKSFLSNPLLAIITLITFDDASRVPTNLVGFYSAAFNALYSRHDWSKGVFIRKHFCGLERTDFEKVFTHFCYSSYLSGSYVFTKDDVARLLGDAISYAGVHAKTSDVFQDCTLSFCLLLVDEPKVIFVHRSFQEYFTAKFVSNYSGPKIAKVLEWLANRSVTDNTFTMVTQLNREAVARHWGIGAIKRFLRLWQGRLESDEVRETLIEFGLHEITLNVSKAVVQSIGFAGTDVFSQFQALRNLSNGSPPQVPWLPTANFFSKTSYANLPPALKRKLASYASGESVAIDPKKFTDPELAALGFVGVVQEMIGELQSGISSLENLVEQQDRIAEMVDLVLPNEPGSRDEK